MKTGLKRFGLALLLMCVFCASVGAPAEEIYSADVEAAVPEAGELALGPLFSGEASEEPAPDIEPETPEAPAEDFPDAAFRAYVLENWDADGDGLISDDEAAKVRAIDVEGLGVTSLAGIGRFAGLAGLKCAGNDIAALDLGGCPVLLNIVKTVCPVRDGAANLYRQTVNKKAVTVISLPAGTVVAEGGETVYDPAAAPGFGVEEPAVVTGQKIDIAARDIGLPAAYCKYSTSNKKVATVSAAGVVTGVKAGSATITATAFDGQKASCAVRVLKPSKVTISKGKLSLGVGETYALTASTPDNDLTPVTWKSGSEKVVTVKDGLLTAKKKGKATITVKTAANKATCAVTVLNAPKTMTIPDEAFMTPGETRALKAAFDKDAGGAVTWRSDDPDVAEVDPSTGALTARELGATTVWAESYNGLTAACAVTVAPSPDSVVLSADAATLGEKMTLDLRPVAMKDGEPVEHRFSYRTGNAKIATVSAAGVVKAVKAGSTTITVTASNGVSAACKVKVVKAPGSISLSASRISLSYDPDAGVAGDYQLQAKLPSGTAASITFASADETVATVDETGLVTAAGLGTTTITAATHNGKQATCKVSVTPPGEKYPVIIVAHRGGISYAEENTLEAFASSPSTGAEMIELDVRTTKDGVQVVNHNNYISAGGKKYTIKSYTYASLKAKKSNLCTLDEALEVIADGGLSLQLELKDTASPSKCVAAVRAHGMEDRTWYISFHDSQLRSVRKLAPEARLGFIFKDSVPSKLDSLIRELKLSALMVKNNVLTESRLQKWQDAGLQVNVWTIDDYAECQYWSSLGVDFITSNYPEKAVEARDSL